MNILKIDDYYWQEGGQGLSLCFLRTTYSVASKNRKHLYLCYVAVSLAVLNRQTLFSNFKSSLNGENSIYTYTFFKELSSPCK